MSVLKIKDGNTWIPMPASGVGVPLGGTQGQVLMKASSTDYDAGWVSPPEVKSITQRFDNLSSYSPQSYYLYIGSIHTRLGLPSTAKIISAGTSGWSGLGVQPIACSMSDDDTVLVFANGSSIGPSSYVTIRFTYVD